MGAGKILAIVAGILTLVGTYVFAMYGATGAVGSGIGFITNLPDLFGNTAAIAGLTGQPEWLIILLAILFIIFLASGVLQIVGMANRVIALIFSLFPLAIGIMYMLLLYTEILGATSALFTLFFIGEQYGNAFPILVNLGDLGLGVYLILAGGALGIVSAVLPREEY